MRTTVQQYADGNVGVRRGATSFALDPVRVVGSREEIAQVLRWEFLGWGVSLPDEELYRIAARVIQVLDR